MNKAVPRELAQRVASLDALYAALDIVEVASASARTAEAVAAVYFSLGGRLELSWLRKQIGGLPADSHWQTLAQTALRDDLASLQRALAAEVLRHNPKEHASDTLIGDWELRKRAGLERCRQVLSDLHTASGLDLSMLSVALRELRSLI